MNTDNCPHCGSQLTAALTDGITFVCGTNRHPDGSHSCSGLCREREAHNKTRESLEQIHSDWKEKCLEADTLRQHLKIAQSLLEK